MGKNSKYIQDIPLNYNNNNHDYNSKKIIIIREIKINY